MDPESVTTFTGFQNQWRQTWEAEKKLTIQNISESILFGLCVSVCAVCTCLCVHVHVCAHVYAASEVSVGSASRTIHVCLLVSATLAQARVTWGRQPPSRGHLQQIGL